MKGSAIDQRLNAWLSGGVLAILIAITTGCSSTSEGVSLAGVGTGGTGSTTSISGKVADGYLVGATVYLDKNGNYQLDAGEPSATTDMNGTYTLNIELADMGMYPIVSMVTKGVTIDKDTNLPVENSYVLSMPKDSVSNMTNNNFISPLTSQLREMLETGIYATTQQAMDALRAKMQLAAGTNMTSDYIAINNTDMHAGAQNIAAVMGNQMGQVFIPSGSTTILDVTRYRGMMGLIFSNMSTVMSANTPTEMSNLNNTITTMMSGIPYMGPSQPYQNMSTTYRGTMGGMNAQTSWMSR